MGLAYRLACGEAATRIGIEVATAGSVRAMIDCAHDERQRERTTRAEAFLAEKEEWRKADLARVRAYVARLQPLLGLAHWRFDVSDELPEEPHLSAHFRRWPRRSGATLRFSDEHFRDSLEEQRDTVVHELCHAVLENLCVAVSEGFDWLEQTSRAWAWERFVHECELTVDHLARILAPSLPLPDAEERGA